MSRQNHTPEPWRTDKECGFPQDIHDANGLLFLRCGSDFENQIYGEANARRIVACVNACAGIRTEALEHRVHLLKAEDAQLAEITKQRDELLAAIETTLDENVHLADGDNCTLIALKRAIASVKGGAA